MALASVQISTEISVSAGTSGNVTVTGVTSGNLLVCYINMTSSTARTFTTSDDKGNTWTEAVRQAIGGTARVSEIEYANNVAAGDTVVTVTASGSCTFSAVIQEISGQATSSVLDTTSSIDEASTNSHVCSADATVIDTTVGTIVCCASTASGTFGTETAGAGYTAVLSAAQVGTFRQYQIFSGAVTNEQGAWTGTTARATAAVIAAFKVADAGATATVDVVGGGVGGYLIGS